MRGLNYFRRGTRRDNGQPCVHLVDSQCKSHRLVVRSSYGAETLAAAHGTEEAVPTLVTLHELDKGVMTPAQLKTVLEQGGLDIEATLTVDAESVHKSLISLDCKVPTEKTLLGHVAWLRALLKKGILSYARWCDTRDMTCDGHTKGCIDRLLLLEAMAGRQEYKHAVKTHAPHRSKEVPISFLIDEMD